MDPETRLFARFDRATNHRCVTLLAVLLTMSLAGEGTAGGDPGGYLLFFRAASDHSRLASAAAIEVFTPARHVKAHDDWAIEIRDDAGRILWAAPTRDPWAVSPAVERDGTVPFTVRIPSLAGAASATLLDHDGREEASIVLDASFRARAGEERSRFEENDRSNRVRVQRLRAAVASRATSLTRPGDILLAKRVDDDILSRATARAASEAEALTHFGLTPRQAARSGGDLFGAAVRQRAGERFLPGAPARVSESATAAAVYWLSGRVRNVETSGMIAGAPLYFYQYDDNGRYLGYIGTTTTSLTGNYATRVAPGYVIIYCGSPASSLFAGQVVQVRVFGDSVADILLFPGVVLRGAASEAGGGPVAGLRVRAENPSFWGEVTADATGRFALIVPRGLEFLLWAEPTPPLVAPEPVDLRLDQDGVHNLILDRGYVLSGRVRSPGGGAIPGAAVILRHLAPTSCATPGWSAVSAADGAYAIAVPRGLRPPTLLLSVHSEGTVRHSAALTVTGNTLHDVTLASGLRVSGMVLDMAQMPLDGAIVRIFQDGVFVTSGDTEPDGSYRLAVEPGVYTFTVNPFIESAASSLAPAKATGVVVTADTTLDFTLQAAEAVVRVRLHYPTEEAYRLGQGVMRLEARRDGRPLQVTMDTAGQVYYHHGSETYVKETRLYLEAGTYDLRIHAIGCDPFTVTGVVAEVGAETSVEETLPVPRVWSGVLRSVDGIALPGLTVLSYDDLSTQYTVHASDGTGRFNVPLTPGGTVRFYSPDDGRAIRRIERLAPAVVDREEDCVLDEFVVAPDSNGVMTQIYGTGDPSERYNLVVLGDGYTDVHETYTDTNHNGMWDGVLFVDLNGNGVWDGGLERYSVYGEALPPLLGSDPTTGNEPFTDLNQDGFPNLDDQATFDANVEGLVRGLFGSDVWSEARGTFNIYCIRLVSQQAGMDILDQDNRIIVERDTALNGWIDSPDRSYTLGVDDALVQQYVNRYAPFADTHVVLLNQPVQIGRANSYILLRGGPTAALANLYTMSHEMGHNVGLLADEYEEFPETYEGPERLRPNITTFTEPDLIPWKDLIPAGRELPSVDLTPGVGLYEGAYYRPGGAYRPVQRCTMRGSERFCPVCTREIRHRVASLTGEFPGGVELIAPRGRIVTLRPGFQWLGPMGASHYRLEVETGGTTVIDGLDLYATRLDLAAELSPARTYRWRVQPGSEHHWGVWSEWATFVTPAILDGAAAGVAAAPGREGSDWHSDLWLHNAGTPAAALRLCFAELGESVDPENCVEAEVAAGATKALRDLVATSFGLVASGAVLWEVVDGEVARLLVEGRTYNRISAHEYMGHAVFGRSWAEAPAAGIGQVVPIAAGTRFRTNLDLVTDHDCSQVRLVIRSADGSIQVDEVVAVNPASWVQLGDMVKRYGLDPATPHTVELTGLQCRTIVGNSVIDNRSNDGTRMLGQTLVSSDEPRWLMGCAYLEGTLDSLWQSSLTLVGGDDAEQRVTVTYVPRGGPWQQRRSQELVVGARSIVTVDNVLRELFGLPLGSVGSLLVEPESPGKLAAFMRTYAVDGDLTYGQYVPPVRDSVAIAPGVEGRIVGGSHSPSLRTNLLLQNTHANAERSELRSTTVALELIDHQGSSVATRTLELGPGENIQINDLVPDLLGAGSQLEDFVIVITATAQSFQADSTGGVIAAISEVNGNLVPGTNDPRLVAARLLMTTQ